MERKDYGNSFREVYMFCPRPVFPAGLRNKIFITLQTLTFNPMLKSFVNYSHFPLCPWSIRVSGALSKFLSPLTVLQLRTSLTNLFSNVFFLFSEFLFLHLKVIKAVPLPSKWEDLNTSWFPEAVVKIWKKYLFLEVWQSSCLSQPGGFLRNL